MPSADGFDVGLLSPATVGHDASVSDAAVLAALVTVEVALTRSWAAAGVAPRGTADEVSDALGWRGAGRICEGHGFDAAALAAASGPGGNPVIPLVGMLRERVPDAARAWLHRGATSQDVLDSALVLIAARGAGEIDASLGRVHAALAALAAAHRETAAAARTLTQHAVPTTWGARFAAWARGVDRARSRLAAVRAALPVQLGGAAGTVAAFAAHADADVARRLPELLAAELGLAAPSAPWHTERWPVTELGDALVQVADALGVIGAGVAGAARTEVGELAERVGGESSAMPQKQNPTASVLLRSIALRAPHLGATLHLAAALAVDERPDGAWHAEWMPLRELLRLVLGAAATGADLVGGLVVDVEAVTANLALTGGLIVSERLGIVLLPRIGRERFDALIAQAAAGGDLRALIAEMPEAAQLDVDDLLDPARYTGLATELADTVTREDA